jgi:hypothetical protein
MRLLYCQLCLSLQYFSTLSDKRHKLWGGGGGKVTEHKMCCDFLYNLYLKRFSLYEEFSKIITINEHRSSRKVPVILVRF